MQWIAAIGFGLLLSLSFSATKQDKLEACLPREIKLTDVVSAQRARPNAGGEAAKKITVKDKLVELKARCKRGKLVDGAGREIRFYHLTGCWGNPPADYQEILERQSTEIEKLKKRYTVIEMTCNPSGIQIP